MAEQKNRNHIAEGKASYQRWADSLVQTEEGRQLYEEEAEKKDLWLQLVEARQAAGLTQAEVAKRLAITQSQVSRIEKRGYDSYTLNTLRRYVKALGKGVSVEVKIHYIRGADQADASHHAFDQ